MSMLIRSVVVVMTTILLTACSTTKVPLTYEVYNSSTSMTFPATSTIFYGKDGALLIDAQLLERDAAILVDKIRASGKPLKMVYISHAEPSFYLGLPVIRNAFPNATIVASPETVHKITQTANDRLSYLQKKMRGSLPSHILIPDVMDAEEFMFEDTLFQLKHVGDQNFSARYLWVPEKKIILGGPLLHNNMHVWLADAKDRMSRELWFNALDEMFLLRPEVVIPSYFLGLQPRGVESIVFTRNYLHIIESIIVKHNNADGVIKNMERVYPRLGGEAILEISAKVLKGEMAW